MKETESIEAFYEFVDEITKEAFYKFVDEITKTYRETEKYERSDK